ncbi:MAG: hypothetical protein HY695_25315 [Deltaproteobacteria bacterium]|nr:hypothetical protein [Deltaproteobacteria bacterium]
MKSLLSITTVVLLYMLFALSSCAVQEEKAVAPAAPAVAKAPPAEKKAPAEKAEAKAKPIKAKGDVGLLDLEKNYMILVTKEGKLITLDFTQKTKATQITPTASKVEDIGLGSAATVEYQSKGEKKIATKVEYKAAKGGD